MTLRERFLMTVGARTLSRPGQRRDEIIKSRVRRRVQRSRQGFRDPRLRGGSVCANREPFARLLPFGGEQMRRLVEFCARAQKMRHRTLDREARTGGLHRARLPKKIA
jgi:hypothetical protein